MWLSLDMGWGASLWSKLRNKVTARMQNLTGMLPVRLHYRESQTCNQERKYWSYLSLKSSASRLFWSLLKP